MLTISGPRLDVRNVVLIPHLVVHAEYSYIYDAVLSLSSSIRSQISMFGGLKVKGHRRAKPSTPYERPKVFMYILLQRNLDAVETKRICVKYIVLSYW